MIPKDLNSGSCACARSTSLTKQSTQLCKDVLLEVVRFKDEPVQINCSFFFFFDNFLKIPIYVCLYVYYHLCMYVLCVYGCQRRPNEDVESSGGGLLGSYEPSIMGARN